MSQNLHLTIEQVSALWFDPEAMRLPSYKLYRVNTPRGRYYYSFDEKGEPHLYIGMTTWTHSVIPEPEGIKVWRDNIGGLQASREYMNVRASYGTLLHREIAEHLMNDQNYDLNKLEDIVREWVLKEPQAVRDSRFFDLEEWIRDMKMDMAAWHQFCVEYEFKPIAIEIQLCHSKDLYSGTIDVPGYMTIQVEGDTGEVLKSGPNKGQPKIGKIPKRVRAIIDIKSTRKTTSQDDKDLQLVGYKELWDDNFPDLPIEKIYNWSPMDWKGEVPTYRLTDKTDSLEADLFKAYLDVAKILVMKNDPTYRDLRGMLIKGQSSAASIIKLNLKEYIKMRSATGPLVDKAPEPTVIEQPPVSNPSIDVLVNLFQELIQKTMAKTATSNVLIGDPEREQESIKPVVNQPPADLFSDAAQDLENVN